jgi:adenine-specific DNA-methyltransferase
MRRVSLLLIDDKTVGPHLQLLRQVCDPLSTSKPHVTVRYFERLPVTEEYEKTRVTHIDLIEPGMFNPRPNGTDDSGSGNQTVFIRCKSDDLAPLEHKPHFPGSDFHITVYDGKSKAFARDVLRELRRLRWGFRVPLSSQVGLTTKELKPSTKKAHTSERVYDAGLKELFRRITSQELSWTHLMSLRKQERLELCRAILKSLFSATRSFVRVPSQTVRVVATSPDGDAFPDFLEVHLTPPELAREIAAYTVSQIDSEHQSIDFGDPAVGTGAFYGALLQLLPRERIASAMGVDINSEQVEAAQWRWADKGMEVLKGDYLHMDRLPPRNLILANPPYLRHQSIPQAYKVQLLERASVRTDIIISARSGLYVYFLLLAHDWMRDGAVAGWLIPGEFMRSVYGRAVRRYLTEKVELIRLHVYGRTVPQFEAVDVSPALVVFRKRKPTAEHAVAISSGGSLGTPDTQEVVTVDDLRLAATWTAPLRLKREETSQFRIGDFFTVRRGIATGANQFFVMTRERARELGIPKSAVKPLLPKVRALPADVVESESDGYPRVSPQLCVIDCSLPETEIRDRYPHLLRYLNTAKRLGILNRRLLKDRALWYRQEHREPPLFLCTYMGRGTAGKLPLRFIWNKSHAIATNTYLLLYPRPALAKILSNDPEAAGRIFSTLQQAAANGIRDHARVYAGGMLKIEPRDLLDVHLAAPTLPPLENIKSQLEFFS